LLFNVFRVALVSDQGVEAVEKVPKRHYNIAKEKPASLRRA
jgi:hypothetical protein